MFPTNFVEKIKAKILFYNFFFKLRRVWNNVEKYCRAGQATENDMAQARCMLGTERYKYSLRIRNT